MVSKYDFEFLSFLNFLSEEIRFGVVVEEEDGK